MDATARFDRTAIRQFMDLLEHQFGSACEIVLHDLSRDYESTIIDIRNNHITGRHVGECGSNLGLEVIRGTLKNGDRFAYITKTHDGKTLRSSTIYLRDTEDNLYALCVNLDISAMTQLEHWFHTMTRPAEGDCGSEEIFVNNVGELVEFFLRQGEEVVGCEIAAMNREQKMKLLEYLDKKGAFLISKSSIRVCEALGISKFTLYNYLESIRNGADAEHPSAQASGGSTKEFAAN